MTQNQDIAGRLEEVARILASQDANRFRVQAYVHAAEVLRSLHEPVAVVFEREGLAGLEKIPGVGTTIAHAIRDILLHGRLAMLDRLRGEADPIKLMSSVPGIGKETAWKLHEVLGIDTLEELEAAAHDGRLEQVAGLGAKRIAGIRDSLAHRLGRVRKPAVAAPLPGVDQPSINELLEVDHEYRTAAREGRLRLIAPRRFNPEGRAWLPILHTSRGDRHYTALFSNTARAHELHKTGDWVVLFFDHGQGERQCTVITSEFGSLKGKRVVRGRERECEDFYKTSPGHGARSRLGG